MKPITANSPTSREVAETPDTDSTSENREAVAEHDVDPNIKNADLPKGIDKPDGELESVNDNLQRVEKRTTM
jgi:hypothetical protein